MTSVYDASVYDVIVYDASIYDVSHGRGVTGYLRRPPGLSSRRVRRTKSTGPKGPPTRLLVIKLASLKATLALNYAESVTVVK